MAISLINKAYIAAMYVNYLDINYTISAGSNRKLVVIISGYPSENAGVTYNDVPLTLAPTPMWETGQLNATCYYLDEADFPSTEGTYLLRANYNTQSTQTKMAVWELHNAHQGQITRQEYSNGTAPSAQGVVIKNFLSPLAPGSIVLNEGFMSSDDTGVTMTAESGQVAYHEEVLGSNFHVNGHVLVTDQKTVEISWSLPGTVTSNNRRSLSINVLEYGYEEPKYSLVHRSVSTHTTSAAPASSAVAAIETPTSGNLLILHACADQGVAGFQPITGWDLVNSVSEPARNDIAVYAKISDGTETDVTVVWGTDREALCWVEEWGGFNGEYAVLDAIGATTGGVSTYSVDSGNTVAISQHCLGIATMHGYRTWIRNYGWYDNGYATTWAEPNSSSPSNRIMLSTAFKESEIQNPQEVDNTEWTHYITSTRWAIAVTLFYSTAGPGPGPEPDPEPTPLPVNKVLSQVKNVTESTDITLNSNVLTPGDFLSIYRNKSLLQSNDLWPLIQYITAGDLLCFASGGTTVLASDVIRDISYWFSSVAAYSDTNFNALWQKKVSQEVVNHIQADINSFDFEGAGVVESEAALLDRLAPVFYYLGNYMCSEAKTTLDALSVGVDADFFNTERKGLYSLLLGTSL